MNTVKLKESAAALVERGEALQIVVPAWTINPAIGTIPPLRRLFELTWLVRRPQRAVIFTDKRILLCRRGLFKGSTVTGVGSTHPRDTKIEFGHGEYMKSKSLGRRLFFREDDTGELLRAENLRRQLRSGHAAQSEGAPVYDDETRASWYKDHGGMHKA